ncbi:hypothetical protein ACWEQG_00085 [Microbispora sp. NPDC004025]
MQRFQLREEGAARRDESFFGHRLSRKKRDPQITEALADGHGGITAGLMFA